MKSQCDGNVTEHIIDVTSFINTREQESRKLPTRGQIESTC